LIKKDSEDELKMPLLNSSEFNCKKESVKFHSS